MAAGLESVDSWLYGEEASKSPAAAQTEVQQPTSENERPSTPTLDDMEAESSTLGAPLPTPTNKIVSTAPELQPKVTTPTEDAQGADEDEEEEEDEEESDSDDDDVQIHIGEIKTTTPVYVRTPSYTRVTIPPGAAGGVLSQGKKVDFDTVPQIRGQSIFEFNLEVAADKPWRMPGADITDFFNYGFMEETWKLYCEKQRRMRSEVLQLNKIAVHNTRGITIPTDTSTRAIPALGGPLAFTTTHGMLPSVSVMTTPTSTFAGAITSTAVREIGEKTPERNVGEQGGDGASDGRATPGVDTTEMSFDPTTAMSKAGLLPPPPVSLPPPPLPFPPPPLHGVGSQDNIAAAMAAAMLGGMRPPDHLHVPGLHPPIGLGLPPGMPPPFPPHLHGPHDGVFPPPFPGMPPPFHLPGGEHGPPPLDERGLPILPEMMGGPGGGGFPWDPNLGPPPQEMFDGFNSRDYRHSHSRSRSSSLSRSRSRSSSDDRERKPRRRERERRHRRQSRSQSRSRERERERADRSDRHRTSRHRREHHRDRHDRERDRDRDRDKNRERDRDRDRDRDREKDRDKEKERGSRRRDKEERSRHERSHRHRSSSRDRKEEDRSSRKERREHREPREAREARAPQQPEVRESRSKSRTPT